MRTLGAILQERVTKVRGLLQNEAIPTAVIMEPANILYLTGYWTILSASSPSALVIDRERAVLVIPGLELWSAMDLGLPWLEVAVYRNYPLKVGSSDEPARGFLEALSQVATSFPQPPTATELDTLRDSVGQTVKTWGNGTFRDMSQSLRLLRASKDDYEIAAIRRAAKIAAGAVSEMRRHISAGMRENALAGHIAGYVWASGGRSTHIVVGSGPRSSLAHPLPTERQLQRGDLILVDIGVLFQNYWSEVARTFVVGKPNTDQIHWHTVVADSQARAARMLNPGVPAAEVDASARLNISSAGFDGTNFTHALGHGVGLLGMDYPLIAPSSGDRILERSAVTLEPALYFYGQGGVRIEDTYLVTRQGVEVLTDSVPRDLVV